MKRRVLLVSILVFMLLITMSLATAAHTVDVLKWGSPFDQDLSFYEFTSISEDFLVTLNESNFSIDLDISPSLSSITGVGTSWTLVTNKTVVASNGDKAFSDSLTFLAPEVSANNIVNVTLTITDSDSVVSVHNNLQITILDDLINPDYNLISHNNRSIVQNAVLQEFEINYWDNESGVDFARMYSDISNSVGWSANMQVSNIGVSGEINKSFVSSYNNPCVTYFFEIKDNAGNYKNKNETSYSGDEHGLFLDFYKPSIALTFPLDEEYTNNNFYNFRADVDDDEFNNTAFCTSEFSSSASCDVYVAGTNRGNSVFTTTTFDGGVNADITNLSDNFYYTWYMECTDASGRVQTSSTRQFGIDRTPPVIDFFNPGNNSIILNGTDLLFNITDALSGVNNNSVWFNMTSEKNSTIDNGSINNLTGSYVIDTSAWTYGPHEVNVSAYDNAGNLQVESYNIIIDIVAPVLNSYGPANNTLGISVTINATDEYSNYTCNLTIDNGTTKYFLSPVLPPGVDTEYSFNLSSLNDGTYSWSVQCSDYLGNENNATEERIITLDRTAPIVSAISPVNGYNNKSNPIIFNYSVIEANLASCSLYINGVLNQTNNNDSLFSVSLATSNNPYEWYVSCIDQVGLIGVSSNESFYHDDIAPVVNAVGVTNDTFITGFNLSVSGETSCYLNIDNTNYSVFSGWNEFNIGIIDGTYSWYVSCEDTWGNTEVVSYSNKIDRTAPVVNLINPVNGENYNSSTNFNYSVNDTFGVNCSLNLTNEEDNFSYYGSIFDHILNESSSSYSWTVTCVDEVGHSTTSSGTGTVFHDTIIPGFNPDLIANSSLEPSVSVSYNQATITWTTDETTSNYVLLEPSNSSTFGNEDTSASVTVTGLSQTTTYTYWVKSCDAAGVANDTTHCITAGPYTFTTTTQNTGGAGGSGGSSGGAFGGGAAACLESWHCSDWSDCNDDSKKTRDCTDTSACGTDGEKPREEMTCTLPQDSDISSGSSAKLESDADAEALENNAGNQITGAVTGPFASLSKAAKIGLSSFLIIVLLGVVLMNIYSKRKKKKAKEFEF